MTSIITTMFADEIALIAGGVTEGPDGKSCTEHDDVFGKPAGSERSDDPFSPITLGTGADL
jgi:hypothetical protein